jgi:hypothetical protein
MARNTGPKSTEAKQLVDAPAESPAKQADTPPAEKPAKQPDTPPPAEKSKEPAEAEVLSLDALIAAAEKADGVLSEKHDDVLAANAAKAEAVAAATAAWDALYDRLIALREQYKTSPGFDRSKLNLRLMRRADQ